MDLSGFKNIKLLLCCPLLSYNRGHYQEWTCKRIYLLSLCKNIDTVLVGSLPPDNAENTCKSIKNVNSIFWLHFQPAFIKNVIHFLQTKMPHFTCLLLQPLLSYSFAIKYAVKKKIDIIFFSESEPFIALIVNLFICIFVQKKPVIVERLVHSYYTPAFIKGSFLTLVRALLNRISIVFLSKLSNIIVDSQALQKSLRLEKSSKTFMIPEPLSHPSHQLPKKNS